MKNAQEFRYRSRIQVLWMKNAQEFRYRSEIPGLWLKNAQVFRYRSEKWIKSANPARKRKCWAYSGTKTQKMSIFMCISQIPKTKTQKMSIFMCISQIPGTETKIMSLFKILMGFIEKMFTFEGFSKV